MRGYQALFSKPRCFPAVVTAFSSNGEEQAVAEAHEALQFLENKLEVKGSKFFGGDNINLVDISATFIAFWVGAAEEALGIEVMSKHKFPKLTEWSDNYINCQAVKDSLPPRENVVAYFKKLFGKA
ncbi:putative glutathione transferase [Helianthus debilis subsp. tardiflorus]